MRADIEDRQTENPYSSRWPSLNPRRARPPATMRATQLTHFGTDQSPMMTVQSAKIRTRWKSDRCHSCPISPLPTAMFPISFLFDQSAHRSWTDIDLSTWHNEIPPEWSICMQLQR